MVNLFATEKELLIMTLLEEHEGLYGLGLVTRSNGKLKRGTVYVTAGRLVDRGLIQAKVDKHARPPGLPRPLYMLTAAGKRMLQAWRVVK